MRKRSNKGVERTSDTWNRYKKELDKQIKFMQYLMSRWKGNEGRRKDLEIFRKQQLQEHKPQ